MFSLDADDGLSKELRDGYFPLSWDVLIRSFAGPPAYFPAMVISRYLGMFSLDKELRTRKQAAALFPVILGCSH